MRHAQNNSAIALEDQVEDIGSGLLPFRQVLKAELARADVGYRELAERLKKHGLQETEASIANKISRGRSRQRFC
jgi:hypothetical protein